MVEDDRAIPGFKVSQMGAFAEKAGLFAKNEASDYNKYVVLDPHIGESGLETGANYASQPDRSASFGCLAVPVALVSTVFGVIFANRGLF